MSEVVLDASALLALINEERGWQAVETVIDQAAISTVNLSEVIAKLAEVNTPEFLIQQTLNQLNLDVILFDETQALIAGLLRPPTKALGLSFGDRACLALAIHQNLPVLTTDQAWTRVALSVEVRVTR